MTAHDRLRSLDARVLGPYNAPEPARARRAAVGWVALGIALVVTGLVVRLTHPVPPLEVGLCAGGLFVTTVSIARLRRLKRSE